MGKIEVDESLCNRCGQCCMRKLRGNPKKLLACPYLIIEENGLTSCKIYERRRKILSRGEVVKIGLNRTCGYRYQSKVDFEGCPYNCPDGSKPVLKIEVKKIKC